MPQMNWAEHWLDLKEPWVLLVLQWKVGWRCLGLLWLQRLRDWELRVVKMRVQDPMRQVEALGDLVLTFLVQLQMS